MNVLTIGIPTRGSLYYKDLFFSIKQSSSLLYENNWSVELVVCINSPNINTLNEEISGLINATGLSASNINIKIIKQNPTKIGKVVAMETIINNSNGKYILFLDDDVLISRSAPMEAIKILEQNRDLKLVGATQRIIHPIVGSQIRNFIYDIINIQQIIDVFTTADPFIFGRFMMVRKGEIPQMPITLYNEDMYLQIKLYPHTFKIKQEVYYRGIAFLNEHFKRAYRLMEGRSQVRQRVEKNKYKEFSNNPLNKRTLDYSKIIKLRPYYLLCFILYRFIRLITIVTKPLLYKKKDVLGWDRIDRTKLTV